MVLVRSQASFKTSPLFSFPSSLLIWTFTILFLLSLIPSWWALLASGTCFSVGVHNFAFECQGSGVRSAYISFLLPGCANAALRMLSTALIQPSSQRFPLSKVRLSCFWFLEMHINRHYVQSRWACGWAMLSDLAQPDKLYWQEAGQARAGAWDSRCLPMG